MAQQRDYILRLIEQLREFLSQITRLRLGERPDEALLAIIQAQERLFSRPADQFLALAPEEQFRILTHAEAASEARDKCAIQADLLAEMGRVYLDKEQPALALGVWHYALQLLELTAARYPDSPPADLLTQRIQIVQRELALLR